MAKSTMWSTLVAEVWVGRTTVEAIVADRIASPLLDCYLARTGISGQATSEPVDPASDNLFAPVPGDPGAHSRFDDRAAPRSVQMALNRHRNMIAAGVAAAAGLGAA